MRSKLDWISTCSTGSIRYLRREVRQLQPSERWKKNGSQSSRRKVKRAASSERCNRISEISAGNVSTRGKPVGRSASSLLADQLYRLELNFQKLNQPSRQIRPLLNIKSRFKAWIELTDPSRKLFLFCLLISLLFSSTATQANQLAIRSISLSRYHNPFAMLYCARTTQAFK